MDNQIKIIVAHTDKQHSFYLAQALKEENYLFKYITTIYDRPRSLTSKAKKFLKGKNLKKANTRSCIGLDDSDVVQYNELFNLIITFLSRFPTCRDLCRRLRSINANSFGKKVAKYAIRNKVDAVIMFDTTAFSCFEYLKRNAPEIKCILDVTIMTRLYTKKIFEDISYLTNDTKIKDENLLLWDKKMMERYNREFKYTDFYLAASQIVRQSIEYCGVSREKIALNPYGVDIEKFFVNEKKETDSVLKLIVVGQLNRRKGIHQLLEIVSKYDKSQVVLDLVGGYEANSDIYLEYKNLNNIEFHGYVTHDKLYKLYQESDIFVLPSFAEGMALVGLEALASGLPLLCSDCTGVNDLIVDGYNGIVIRAGYIEDLYKGIEWFRENKKDIKLMSKNARSTAEEYTWNKYSKRTSSIISEYLEKDKLV